MNSVELPLLQHFNTKAMSNYEVIYNHCYLTKIGKKFVTVFNGTYYGGVLKVK